MIGPKNGATLFCFLDNEGSGAPIGAGVENCTCYQVQPRSVAGPLTSRCSTVRIDRTFVLPGPGQRFLELPDANGSSALPLRRQCSEHLAVQTHAGRA